MVVYEGVPNVPSCFKNVPAEPADGTKFPFPVPIALLNSDADWSAVADASIASNLDFKVFVKLFCVNPPSPTVAKLLVKAIVPVAFGRVNVLSPLNVPANKVASCSSATLPSNTIPF